MNSESSYPLFSQVIFGRKIVFLLPNAWKEKWKCLVSFHSVVLARSFKLYPRMIFLSCHVGQQKKEHFKVMVGSFNRKHLHSQWDFFFPCSAQKEGKAKMFRHDCPIFDSCVCVCLLMFICLISIHLSSFLLIIIRGFFMISLLFWCGINRMTH